MPKPRPRYARSYSGSIFSDLKSLYAQPWPGIGAFAFQHDPTLRAMLEGRCITTTNYSAYNLNQRLDLLREGGFLPIRIMHTERISHWFLYDKLDLGQICRACERDIPRAVMNRLTGKDNQPLTP